MQIPILGVESIGKISFCAPSNQTAKQQLLKSALHLATCILYAIERLAAISYLFWKDVRIVPKIP
eukprot:6186850-Pleurochrysis_carterae.AAC.4